MIDPDGGFCPNCADALTKFGDLSEKYAVTASAIGDFANIVGAAASIGGATASAYNAQQSIVGMSHMSSMNYQMNYNISRNNTNLDYQYQTNGGTYVGSYSAEYYSRVNTGSIGLDGVSYASGILGIAGSIGEYSNVIDGTWQGANGNWYRLGWGGNGATGARIISVGKAIGYQLVQKGAFAVGAGVSLYQFGTKPTIEQGVQSGADIVMGAIGVWGGPPGAFFSAMYFIDGALRNTFPAYKNFQNTQQMLNTKYRRYDVCFIEGTLVYAESGLIKIEELKEGMNVYSYNFDTDSLELKLINKFLTREVREIYEVQVGAEQILVTGEHPFYLKGQGWTKVKELKDGDLLLNSEGETIEIESVNDFDRSVTVYNIEVADNNNFYVTASKILVHNKNVTSSIDSENKQLLRNEK